MSTVTVCLTIYNRPVDVLKRVFDSLKDQAHDKMVVVMDRSPKDLVDYVKGYWALDGRFSMVEIAGRAGWLCPAKAWNVGFGRVKTDLIYCLSSEVVQEDGNVARAVATVDRYDGRAVLFGSATCSCGPEGKEVNWGDLTPGNILVDSKHPRPLGFIWCGPMEAVRDIKGFDEGYMGGYWYDDDDFTHRLYKACPRYVFDDSVSGVHQHHDRAELTEEGILRNRNYHLAKWRNMAVGVRPAKIYSPKPGLTVWEG